MISIILSSIIKIPTQILIMISPSFSQNHVWPYPTNNILMIAEGTRIAIGLHKTIYVCLLACSYSLNRVQLCDPMDCSPPGSSVHGNLQETILEWGGMPSSRGSSQPRDRTHVLCLLHRQAGSLPLAPPYGLSYWMTWKSLVAL